MPRLVPLPAIALSALLFVLAAAPAEAAPPLVQLSSGTTDCISEDGTGGVCTDGSALVSPQNVAVSPDGKNVYVASLTSDAVVALTRNTTTGALSHLGCISEDGTGGVCANGRGLDIAVGVTVSPDGANVYVKSQQSVAIFTRNTTTGALTQSATTAACHTALTTNTECTAAKGVAGGRGLAVSPDNENLYVAGNFDNAIAVFQRGTGGALTQESDADGCISETGTSGACEDGKALSFPSAVAVSPDNENLYVSSEGSSAVAVLGRDTSNGHLSQATDASACVSETGSSGACADGRGMNVASSVAISPDGEDVYVTGQFGNSVASLARDGTSGNLTQAASSTTCVSETGSGGECTDGKALSGPTSIVVSPDGESAYVASETSDAIAVFFRGGDGRLGQLPGTAGCVSETGTSGQCVDDLALDGARGVAVSPNGASVYAASSVSNAVAAYARASDDDGDGVTDTTDICPSAFDPNQTNTDGLGDGGDACDTDDDQDGLADTSDNCRTIVNPGQQNNDRDDEGDPCDDDDDNDGARDVRDNCPLAANADQDDTDRDDQGDACDPDDDNDGRSDAQDNCRTAGNPNQENNDGDPLGDVCDSDDDNDGDLDTQDNCRTTVNPQQENADDDPAGDACDADDDNDGRGDGDDNCLTVPNPGQENLEGDPAGDACDGDDDDDGRPDGDDNCPRDANADQVNTDGGPDGGDACDPNDDDDAIADGQDNCQTIVNSGQEDTDGTGGGNACDADDDDDRLPDVAEAERDTSVADLDSDDDGIGDADEVATSPTDPDSDNDKLQDGLENGLTQGIADPAGPVAGTDPEEFEADKDPRTKTNAEKTDSDGDRLNDGKEDFNRNGKFERRKRETNPLKKDTDGDGVNDRRDRKPLNRRRR